MEHHRRKRRGIVHVAGHAVLTLDALGRTGRRVGERVANGAGNDYVGRSNVAVGGNVDPNIAESFLNAIEQRVV